MKNTIEEMEKIVFRCISSDQSQKKLIRLKSVKKDLGFNWQLFLKIVFLFFRINTFYKKLFSTLKNKKYDIFIKYFLIILLGLF